MKNFLKTVALTAILFAGGAQASQTFDYSYTFDNGQGQGKVASGSFTGDVSLTDLNLITDISNATLNINGAPLFSGTTFVQSYNGSNWVNSGVVISVNGANSNFIFANTADSGQSKYFYVIPWLGGIGAQAQVSGNAGSGSPSDYLDYNNGQYIQSNWKVSAVSAVPEPETYAMLLAGLGLMGFMVRRRKTS